MRDFGISSIAAADMVSAEVALRAPAVSRLFEDAAAVEAGRDSPSSGGGGEHAQGSVETGEWQGPATYFEAAALALGDERGNTELCRLLEAHQHGALKHTLENARSWRRDGGSRFHAWQDGGEDMGTMVTPSRLADLVALWLDGSVSRATSDRLLLEMTAPEQRSDPRHPRDIAVSRRWTQITDAATIEAACLQVIADDPTRAAKLAAALRAADPALGTPSQTAVAGDTLPHRPVGDEGTESKKQKKKNKKKQKDPVAANAGVFIGKVSALLDNRVDSANVAPLLHNACLKMHPA